MIDMPTKNDLLGNFTALDLETTGLSPQNDAIIEMGAVRVRDGEICEEFSRLIDPGRPLPRFITRLTGITDADLEGQPSVEALLPELEAFLGADALVAHNASFDLGFVNAGLERQGRPPLSNPVLDTLLLSGVLLPRLRDHRLATLTEYYGVDLERAHRAVDDARATAGVYLALTGELAALDPEIAALLARLSAGAGEGARIFFELGLRRSVGNVLKRKISSTPVRPDLMQSFTNLSGEIGEAAVRREEGAEPDPLDLEDLVSVFGSRTALGRALGSYERRPQQIQMVEAVARAFHRGEFLAVEAGTGTGKSLAYLVPAVIWAVRNDCRVIISTHTKNLQDQLFYKDIPLLHRALEEPFVSALVKGRSNYLCLNKWHRIIEGREPVLTGREWIELLPLVRWVHQTTTGDVAENTGFRGGGELWSKLCAERNYCLGPRCPYHGRCFLMRIRRAAAEAHIVVVNHSLFFSDLAAENAVLSEYDFVIFDEAHRLEEVATQYLGSELNWWTVRAMLNRLYQRERAALGTLASLDRRLKKSSLGEVDRTAMLDGTAAALQVRQDLWHTAMEFFRALTEAARAVYGQAKSEYIGKYRYRAGDRLLQMIAEPGRVMRAGLVRLHEQVRQLAGQLQLAEIERIEDGAQLLEELLARMRDAHDLVEALDHLLKAEEDSHVFWVEIPVKEDGFDARLLSAPLNVDQLMRTLVYDRLRSAVHTSATLTVAGRFDYLLQRIGLNLVEPERLRTLSVGSPFDFEEQALVCVPAYLPTPKETGFLEALTAALGEVLTASRGGALVLFTSYDMLGRVYGALEEPLSQEGLMVLGQGRDGSRTNLLNRFREQKEAVLMGTSSFWEGVDIPGDSLRLLVLVKLPFQVPTEPVVEAHVEQMQRAGRNAFYEYLLPEAVIRFRQGFGRLIRRADDHGVVLIMDSRVLSTRYGSTFLGSLPVRTWAVSSAASMESDIQRWLQTQKKPPAGGAVELDEDV
jgi:predicted DnaQ family exonuclease/DinG family helicase